MVYHVLTLFPDMINTVVGTSILGRAQKSGAISLDVIDIRDFSTKKTLRVDDYPYGGGAGMVMEAEPVFRAVAEAKKRSNGDPRVIYLTPSAQVLNQVKAEELACEDELILLCGHYEGIDERVLSEVVTDNISIGDYVLTGGEIGACVLMDAVSRFVPGVLSNKESSQFESHQDNLLEYPQYTRPIVWHDMSVPSVLLCGDHEKVEKWRHEQSLIRTKERRPDLLEKSYRVNVLYFGTDAAGGAAINIGDKVSRYAVYFDYNRNKLKKQKRRFCGSDFVIVVTDDCEDLDTALERVSAHGASVVLITYCKDAKEGMDDYFGEKGFLYKKNFIVGKDFDVNKLSLDIRKLMDCQKETEGKL